MNASELNSYVLFTGSLFLHFPEIIVFARTKGPNFFVVSSYTHVNKTGTTVKNAPIYSSNIFYFVFMDATATRLDLGERGEHQASPRCGEEAKTRRHHVFRRASFFQAESSRHNPPD